MRNRQVLPRSQQELYSAMHHKVEELLELLRFSQLN